MQTLQIDQKKAQKLFPTATPEFKEMLIDTFGESFFSQKITDRIKTFEDACEVLGYKDNISVNGLRKDEISILAYGKLIIISRALNEGWEPDWNDGNQYKWYPWFKMKAGFGFSDTDYVDWYTCTDVGSRLCFKSSELAEYAGKQFESIYNDFLNL